MERVIAAGCRSVRHGQRDGRISFQIQSMNVLSALDRFVRATTTGGINNRFLGPCQATRMSQAEPGDVYPEESSEFRVLCLGKAQTKLTHP